MLKSTKILLFILMNILISFGVNASHISGIRITQTGNTGLMINVDVTAFYTTGSTETTANLGTYYNQVPAIDWGDGSTVPRYGYGSSTGIPLVATSTVVNGIPARSYRGSFSHTYGSAGSYEIKANTGCCPQTTPTYTLVSGDKLTTTVTTTGPFGPTTFTTSFVQNTLAVGAVIPSFSKVFAPDSVAVGVLSSLTFTIDNTASTLDNNALDFTDNLPAGLVVATPANVINTCTGGTITAVSDTAVFSYTGGAVSAGSSCSITVDTVAALPGVLNNTSGDLTSAFGNSGTSSDTLTVTAVPLSFSKVFSPSSVGIGFDSTLTFTINNSNAADATGIDFTDNLPAGLTISSPSNASNTCTGGTLTAIDGTNVISYTSGSVLASSSCLISVDTVAMLPGDYMNTTGDLTSVFGNSGTASDSLNVTAMLLTFNKVFEQNPVGVGSVSTLTFNLDNMANMSDVTAIDFTDNLPAGLLISSPANVVNTCVGGTLTAVDGTNVISYTGGTVSASSSCEISVDTVAMLPGDYLNTTGDLTSVLGNSGTASDTLTVTAIPLSFSKVFSPSSVGIGVDSTLTFTIDNGNAANATAIEFTDNLPAGLTISSPANVNNTCVGGTLTAVDGSNVLSYSGGSVPASSVCNISVNTMAMLPGDYVNTSGDLTSVFGNSGPASDTLTVTAMLLTFNKVFGTNPVGVGVASTLTFSLDNTANMSDVTAIDFTDTLPADLIIASPSNAMNNCVGGTLTADDGTSVINYTGGSVLANSSCTISVDTVAVIPGDYVNTTDDLTSGLGNSGTASDTLTVTVEPLVFGKLFGPNPTGVGAVSTLTFSIDNIANAADATALDFTDDLPAGLLIATPANTSITACTGGTLTAVGGSTMINYTGGSVPAFAICMITVDTVAMLPGDYVNTTGDITSVFGNNSTANDTLTVSVMPISFNKVFSPSSVGIGVTSTLTFTIDNTGNMEEATGLQFTDNLPTGLTIATPANTSNTCVGGTLNAVSGASIVSYTGGSVSAGVSCSISVDTNTMLPGVYVNTSEALTSIFGNSGTANDTLTVTATPLVFSKTFTPDTSSVGVASTLVFTIDNSSNLVDITTLDFTDNLPAGMVVSKPANLSNTCTGGTLTAVSGTNAINYTGGLVSASSVCQIGVDVVTDNTGVFNNVSGDLTSSIGNSGTASDTLTVTDAPGFIKSFTPDMVAINTASRLSFTINNSSSVVDAINLNFVDNMPANMLVATPNNASTDCIGGTLTAIDGANSISYTGGQVTAGTSCNIEVDVIGTIGGDLENVSGNLTSSLGNSGTASATLNTSSSPLFTKVFSPNVLIDNFTTTLTFTIDNSANGIEATELSFVDDMPDGMTVAKAANVVNSCIGGNLTANPGDGIINYSGGTVLAGSICTISVDINVDEVGDFNNVASALSSSLGTSGQASAFDNLLVSITQIIPSLSIIGIFLLIIGLFSLVYFHRKQKV